MFPNSDTSRLPSERVGTLSNVALPPPSVRAGFPRASRPDHLRVSGGIAAEVEEEQCLLRALRNRDEGAFESLLKRYDAALLGLAGNYVRNHEDAEEVVQDTWLAVLNGLDRFAGRSSLKTWIFRILVNRARTRAKREARSIPFSRLRPWRKSSDGEQGGREAEPTPLTDGDQAPPWHDPAWRPPTAEEGLLAQELRARVQAAMEELPGPQREVVKLRDVEGWSAGEVRGALQLSEANQRVLLHRGRARIRSALGSYLREGPVATAQGAGGL